MDRRISLPNILQKNDMATTLSKNIVVELITRVFTESQRTYNERLVILHTFGLGLFAFGIAMATCIITI